MRKAFTALSFNGISGDYLEFGSWSGNTFTLAYQQSRRVGHQCKLWSFDSFQGLPDQAGAEDEHPHWQKAAMSMSLQQFNDICRQHNIPVSDYQVVPGYYTDTIGNESNLSVFPRDVALAYIDRDMYSSTKVVLSFLANRLKHGMIIAGRKSSDAARMWKSYGLGIGACYMKLFLQGLKRVRLMRFVRWVHRRDRCPPGFIFWCPSSGLLRQPTG